MILKISISTTPSFLLYSLTRDWRSKIMFNGMVTYSYLTLLATIFVPKIEVPTKLMMDEGV
jgi:hypothetical protein